MAFRLHSIFCRFFFVFIGVVLAVSGSDSHASIPGELAAILPAMQQLCSRSPEIVTADSNLKVTDLRERVTSRFFIPQIVADASFGLKDPTPFDNSGFFGSGSVGTVGVSAQMNMSPLFGPALEASRAEVSRKSSNFGWTVTVQAQAIQLFEQILAMTSLIAREADLEQTKLRLDRQYRTLEKSVRAGLTRQRDQQRFEAELLRVEESRLRLKRSRLEAKERLTVLLGPTSFDIDKIELDWRKLVALMPDKIQSIETSPELEQAKLKVESAELDLRMARQRTGLVTSLTTSYSVRNSTLAPSWTESSLREPYATSWFAGISFKLPLWDNGSDHLARTEAGEAARIARIQYDQAERDFRSRRDLLDDERERLLSRISLANRLNVLERKSFEQVALDYREGRVGYLEWFNASQSLQNSVEAQIELASEWAKLWMRVRQLKGDLATEVCRAAG